MNQKICKTRTLNQRIPADKIVLILQVQNTRFCSGEPKKFSDKILLSLFQKFHNERAVFWAQHYGIKAHGFNAKDVNKYFGFKPKVREYFARAKVFVDFLLGENRNLVGES